MGNSLKPVNVRVGKDVVVELIAADTFGTLHSVDVLPSSNIRDYIVDQITLIAEDTGPTSWKVAFYDGPNGVDADLDLDETVFITTLSNGTVTDVAGAEYWSASDICGIVRLSYSATNPSVPDFQKRTLQLNFRVGPVGAGKTAGATGELILRFVLRPLVY